MMINSFSSSKYDGVIACGPGPYQGGTDHAVQFTGSSFTNYEWECVELSARFLDRVDGQGPYSAPGGKDIVANYPGSNLTKVNNNGSSLPSPGDVFSESGTQSNPYGHTGVITSVNVTNGSGTVSIIEQNNSSSGINTINVSNNTLQSNVTGWLHNSSGGGGSSITPRVSALQYGSGEMDAYKLASDGSISKDTYQSSSNTWGGWSSMGTPFSGGTFVSNPSAIQFNSEMDVFATNGSGTTDKDTWLPANNNWGGFLALYP